MKYQEKILTKKCSKKFAPRSEKELFFNLSEGKNAAFTHRHLK
jgi:hypothetical protein